MRRPGCQTEGKAGVVCKALLLSATSSGSIAMTGHSTTTMHAILVLNRMLLHGRWCGTTTSWRCRRPASPPVWDAMQPQACSHMELMRVSTSAFGHRCCMCCLPLTALVPQISPSDDTRSRSSLMQAHVCGLMAGSTTPSVLLNVRSQPVCVGVQI